MLLGSSNGCRSAVDLWILPQLSGAGAADKTGGAQVRERHGSASTLGNEPGVRTWRGDVQSVPAFQGPFDAAFLGAATPGRAVELRDALLRAALLLRPGACCFDDICQGWVHSPGQL